jgi:hypothetical protein
MTVGRPTGAPSAEGLHWARIDWRAVRREVYRLQVRAAGCSELWRRVRWCAIVTASMAIVTVRRVFQPFQVLEPCAGKLARTVPRGRGTGNRLLLPGVPATLRVPAAGYAQRSAPCRLSRCCRR